MRRGKYSSKGCGTASHLRSSCTPAALPLPPSGQPRLRPHKPAGAPLAATPQLGAATTLLCCYLLPAQGSSSMIRSIASAWHAHRVPASSRTVPASEGPDGF